MACSPCRLSRPQQPLQTSTDCKANQLIKKKFPYSFIKLKFHSAHLVWLLCAQVAGIDSQPQFESVSLSRTHHPIHIPSIPIPIPIPDSQFHSQPRPNRNCWLFPVRRLVYLFVLACPLSPVPPCLPLVRSSVRCRLSVCFGYLTTALYLPLSSGLCPVSSGCL